MELLKEKWSENLKKIKPVVKNLYHKGNVDLLFDESPKLAIVGSRRMTEYGKSVIEKWMPDLVNKGLTIVSGFMYGVDQVAHKACIENGGKTIAVLGWGIDMKPSSEDEKLYQNILQVDSLILSEYEGEMQGTRATFPARNRIVAGISDAVLVIEAAEKSGSLITARLATKMEKILMALPGRVDVAVARGTNGLIKDGLAQAVTSASDVLRLMKMQVSGNEKKKTTDVVLLALENGGLSVDELARVLKMSVPELIQKLMILTLQGEVREVEGKYFVAI